MIKPKITIIVPVYNAEKKLPACFSCLLGQTLTQQLLHLTFIDDCSTDNSVQILNEFALTHSNVTILHTLHNTGVAGNARNLGLDALTTPYVMFLDADDVYTSDACEILLSALEKNNADLASGYCKRVDEYGRILSEKPIGYGDLQPRITKLPEQLADEFVLRDSFWCKIYKTDLIRKNNLRFPVGTPAEDLFFLYSYILCCSKAVYTAQHIYNYTQNSASVMSCADRTFYRGIAHCYHDMQDLFAAYGAADVFPLVTEGILEYHLRGMSRSRRMSVKDIAAVLPDWQWLFEFDRAQGRLQNEFLASHLDDFLKMNSIGDGAEFVKSFAYWENTIIDQISHSQNLERRVAALSSENTALRQSKSFRLGYRILHPWKK